MLENIEILLVTTGRRWSYLVWEPNYHSINFKNLVAIEMKKIEIIINEPVYLWLLKYLCMYVKPKYGEKAKMCYMDKDRIIVYKKNRWYLQSIGKHVQIKFDTSNYELDWPLPKGKNKKVIGLMKAELGGWIMTKIKSKNWQLLNRWP